MGRRDGWSEVHERNGDHSRFHRTMFRFFGRFRFGFLMFCLLFLWIALQSLRGLRGFVALTEAIVVVVVCCCSCYSCCC